MSRKLEIVLWVFGIVIPLALLGVGVAFIQSHKRGTTTSTTATLEPAQLLPPSFTTAASGKCSAEPVACDLANPTSCSACGAAYVCTTVGPNDTNYDIQGAYCLPTKPVSACTAPALDPSARMQGQYRWTGWGGVDVQGWSCACPYPRLYPMDTTAGSLTEGACKRSSDLCRGGVWQFPCRRDPADPTKCEELTEAESAALVGADPLQYGMCDCDNVPCVAGDECVSGVCGEQGVCVGQRVGLNSRTGLPACVPDTCARVLTCNLDEDCVVGACVNGRCQQACVDDGECGDAGRCGDGGVCEWGWWELANVAPYLFGACH